VGNQRRLGLAAREQHVFVDETKRRGYLLVASVVIPGEVDALRRTLRGLVLPGQRRLHRKDENDRTRRSIATAISASAVTAIATTLEGRCGRPPGPLGRGLH